MAKSKLGQLSRSAIIMEIGGFRPPEDPQTSWFGKVNLAAAGETWPLSGGKPMHALCQINLMELPSRPPHLDDLAMITVFIGPDELPVDQPNGENWCLRAYRDLGVLRPLEQMKTGSTIKALAMRPRVVEADFPCLDDVSELGIDADDDYPEKFPHVEGLKLGGWPTLVQSTISWAPWNDHPSNPEYVFQINSTEKGRWQWGDGGVGYFGRGTTDGTTNEWTISWQCY